MKSLLPIFLFLHFNLQKVFLTTKKPFKNILGNKKVQIGDFSNQVYKGTWRSA